MLKHSTTQVKLPSVKNQTKTEKNPQTRTVGLDGFNLISPNYYIDFRQRINWSSLYGNSYIKIFQVLPAHVLTVPFLNGQSKIGFKYKIHTITFRIFVRFLHWATTLS